MDETWVEETDWSKVAIGDRVQVRLGESVLTGQVADRYISHRDDVVYALGLDVGNLAKRLHVQGAPWSLFVPAKAAVTLPTEPGWYLDVDEDVWRLCTSGGWVCTNENYKGTPDAVAPFVRLELVPKITREVLDRFASFWEFEPPKNIADEIKAVAAEFGVTDL